MTKGGVVSMFASVEAVQVLWEGNVLPPDGGGGGECGQRRRRDRQGSSRDGLPIPGSVRLRTDTGNRDAGNDSQRNMGSGQDLCAGRIIGGGLWGAAQPDHVLALAGFVAQAGGNAGHMLTARAKIGRAHV